MAMNNFIETGLQDRTNASSVEENIIPFNQDPLSPYVKKEFSLLNIRVKKGMIKFPSIPIPDETPEYAIDRMQKLFDRTIRVLSRNVPHDPCWIFTGATDQWGYARHNPEKITKAEEGYSSDSVLIHRYVYQYLYMPKGLPIFTSDGETLWEIDHVCGRGHRGCVNPRHLEIVDRPTNVALGNHDNL
jgi:hypothetical protein